MNTKAETWNPFAAGTKYLLMFSVALLGALSFALSSCGGKGGESAGPPLIGAELISFPAGSVPLGFTNNASVVVLDDLSGDSITNATVTMNGVTLAYNAANQDYEGNVVVAPGDAVALSVTVGGNTYSASTTQFTSYPTPSVPASGDTWDSGVTNAVTWSGGGPTANATYGLGILDAADPNGPLVWPISHVVQQIPIGSTSQSIPTVSITAGNRLLVVGIVSMDVAIPEAAPGSRLLVGGFNYVPITVTGLPVTSRRSGTAGHLQAVAWSGTQFAAVGGIGGVTGTILTSLDGITWTSRSSGASAVLNGVASSGTQFVAVGSSSTSAGPATILTSPDGISWTSRVSGATGALTGVAWSGAQSQFVAVGSNPGVSETILTSPDAVMWTSRGSGAPRHLSAVTWSGTQFVAVGADGLILTSLGGTTWTAQIAGTTVSLRGVVWSGAQFVAVGPNSCCGDVILTSPDGVTWTQRSSGGTWPLAVAWSGAEFVAVGGVSNVGGTIITSPDGITWTPRASGTGDFLTGIVWSGTKFVMVGGNGTILTSP